MAYIKKLKSGKYYVQIRKRNQPTAYKTFIELKLARKWAKSVEVQIDKGIYNDLSEAQSTTLKELIIKYRDEIAIAHKARRSTSYKLNYLSRQKIATKTLTQIKSKDLWDLKEHLELEDLATKTINIYIQLLQQVWNTAKRRWSITLPAQSPFELITLDKVNNARDEILTTEEYQKLLEAAVHSKLVQLRDLIEFGYETAARISEILKLSRNDVDLNNKLAMLRNTKNGEDRTIPLTDKAIEILKRNPFGDRFFKCGYDSVLFYFRQARKRAGIPKFVFHSLRACAITNMLLRGMKVEEVATISGHKSWSMLKRYTRIRAADLVEKVNNVVAKII